jgi:hypothetical protein
MRIRFTKRQAVLHPVVCTFRLVVDTSLRQLSSEMKFHPILQTSHYLHFMRCLLFTLLLISTLNAAAQRVELITTQLPIRNGFIYFLSASTAYCMRSSYNGVAIVGSSDSCFATTDGMVVSVVDLGDGNWVTIIKDKSRQLHAYANLSQPILKTNTVVKKGDYLGSVLNDDSNTRELLYIISDEKGRYIPRKETLEFLHLINRNGNCFVPGIT